MAELEESRRKLVIQQLQRHGVSLMNVSSSNGVNGTLSTDKSLDKSMGWGDLKDAVDEAKVLLIIHKSIVLHMYSLYMSYLLSLYLIAANLSNGGQTLAANRLFELHETQEDNLILSRQLEDLQVGTFFCNGGG